MQKTAPKDYGRRIVAESLYCDLVYNVWHLILTDGEPVLAYGLYNSGFESR
jgi:hypothetical protein